MHSDISRQDLAYYAGFFDGEGCITTSITSRFRKRSNVPIVTVGIICTTVNTHLGVLKHLQKISGGHLVHIKSTKRNPRNLPTHRLNLDANYTLFTFLPLLIPHLVVKKRQAEIAMLYLESRKNADRGTCYTEAEIDLLFELRLLNQKPYNKGRTEHIIYKKVPYTRSQFWKLVCSGRDGAVYRVVNWTKDMDVLVGTASDRSVATKLGLKMSQVQRRRVQLGRPPSYYVPLSTKKKVIELRRGGVKLKEIISALNISKTSVQRILST